MTKGQINHSEGVLGDTITNLVAQPDVHTIVEIGTWNGLGSTRCILQGITGKENYQFISLEADHNMFTQALHNNKHAINDNFSILNGKIINEDFLTSWFNVDLLSADQANWLSQDFQNLKKVPNVLEKIPQVIDFLLLDGGEFSTYLEWQILKPRIKYCVLDDTKELKCKKIREEVLGSKKYKIINDNTLERNGFLVFSTI